MMKSLFILLLLMNVSYLVWGVAFSEKKEMQVLNELNTNIQKLTLLHEGSENYLSKANSKVEQVENDETEQSDILQSRLCYSVGPFLEEEKLNALEGKLNQQNIAFTTKSIVDKEPKSYWLYLPAAKTMAEAKKSADKLKADNVKDYFIIRTGNNARAISLGLFNSYRRAKIREDNLLKLGVKAKIKTRYRDVTRYWLDYQQAGGQVLDDGIWKQNEDDEVLQKIARPCVDPLPESG